MDPIFEFSRRHNFNIVAPSGGFGNHLRWLIFLDPSFEFYLHPHPDHYAIFAGPDYPNYHDYCNLEYGAMAADVKKEMLDSQQAMTLYPPLHFGSMEQRITCLENYVYPQHRSWHNWLNFEWRYRLYLDQILGMTHSSRDIDPSAEKVIVTTIDTELAYRCYLKFNSSFNNHTVVKFLDLIEKTNQRHISMANDRVMVIDLTDFFQPVLDKKLYDQVCQWLDLSDQYPCASRIHRRWYDLHKQAESAFFAEVQRLYRPAN